MNKNWYFLGVCILLVSTGLLVISTSRVSSLNLIDNTNRNAKGNLNELPKIAQVISWDTGGNPVCVESDTQIYIEMISDGNGGAIMTWWDYRNENDYDIYAQHIDSNGDVQWGDNGIAICDEDYEQSNQRMCSDGDGGAIITWHDKRSDSDFDIYAQRIDSDGNIQWTSNGISICDEDDDQKWVAICNDEDGGAIITWQDDRDGLGDEDIYAKRIDSDGDTVWGGTQGLVVCDEDDNQWEPEICSDGAGGATICWEDNRDGDFDIYAQYINYNGYEQWTTDGKPVCLAEYGQYDRELISNGAGAAIIVWKDQRNGLDDIYAQYIDSDGNGQWGINGLPITTAEYAQNSFDLCSDGAGGAIITWRSQVDTSAYDIYAQHVDSDGDPQWVIHGIPICDEDDNQFTPDICGDGGGGAIITWEDYRSGSDFDIYAQRINSDGIEQWVEDGILIGDEDEDLREPIICSDGLGGSIIAWHHDVESYEYDLYAQRIENPAPISNHPADFNTSSEGVETINWTLSDDSGGGMYRVLANLSEGSNSVIQNWTSWTSGSDLHIVINRASAGTFAYRIEYYDDQHRSGLSDTVIVQITKDSTINGYSIFILSLSICLIGLVITIRLTRRKKQIN